MIASRVRYSSYPAPVKTCIPKWCLTKKGPCGLPCLTPEQCGCVKKEEVDAT